jgi:2C-methyl-D-erythritol 2,4-cyclodiphosphate synthase
MIVQLEAAGMPEGSVNIKATRGEGMGFVGREEGIACLAVALIKEIV